MNVPHLIWIGSVVPNSWYQQLCEKGYKNQQASRIAQLNIIKGLEAHYNTFFDYISGPALPAYPQYPEIITSAYSWVQENGVHGELVSYLNIEYINRIFKANAMKRAADKLIGNYEDRDNAIIFVNSPHTPFIKAGMTLKKKFKNAKLVLVVPDLPQFMESSVRPLKKMLKAVDISTINNLIKKFDYYVLYTQEMIQYLDLPQKRCVVMEGCVSEDSQVFQKTEGDHPFTFMYSGKVDYKFGMDLLIKAFSKIEDPDCRLVVTGTGDAESLVRCASEKDVRIQYMGFVSDYSKVKQLQADADVMMNMRLPSETSSKYCFPSKLFEYMKTGNPVISFKIQGIKDEYYDYLLTAKHESAEDLYHTMQLAMKMPVEERRAFGENARNYIMRHKNIYSQTKAIYDLIETQS